MKETSHPIVLCFSVNLNLSTPYVTEGILSYNVMFRIIRSADHSENKVSYCM